MMMAISSVAVASSTRPALDSLNFDVINEFFTDDYWVEVSEHNGRIFYFRNTEFYTISMDLYPEEGILNIFRRDKQTDIITFEAIDLTSSIGRDNNNALDINTVAEQMEDVAQLVSDGLLELGNTLYVESSMNINYNNDAGNNFQPFMASVTDANVLRELRGLGHTARSWWRTGHTLSQHGFTARLYEETVLSSVNLRAMRITAGLLTSAVAVLIGKPVGIVAILFTVVQEGTNLVIAATVDASEHRISVRYRREGRIAPYPGGWASEMRDISYTIIVGEGGRTAATPLWDVPFNRTPAQILQAAINMRVYLDTHKYYAK